MNKTLRAPFLFLVCAVLLPIATFGQGGPPGATVLDLLYADPDRDILFAATDAGVFRSADGGRTWAQASGGLPGFTVTQIVGRPDQLFVSLDGGGVYRSRNGEAWVEVSDGLTPDVISLANDPNNPNILFAGTRTNGVFFSNNAGDGWIRPGGAAGSGLTAGSYPYIAFAPADSNRIFASNAAGFFFESVDAGRSWTTQAAGAEFRQIVFDPSNPEVVYVGTGIGLIRRDTNDSSFGLVEGLGSLSIVSLAVDPLDSDLLYAYTEEAALLISRDRGASWGRGGVGLPKAFIRTLLALPEQPKRLLAGLSGTGVFFSTDEGVNWSASVQGMNGADVLAVAAHPTNAGVVFATTDGGGVFRSDDSGETWVESRDGVAQFRPAVLAIDPADPNRMYLGSASPLNPLDGALSQSTDGGKFWSTIASSAPVFSVALHPTDSRTIWVGSSAGTFFFPSTPLFASFDGGQTFGGVVGDDGILLQTGDVRHVAVDPQNPRNVYLATDSGFRGAFVLWSDDEGDEFRIGTASAPAGALVVDPTDPRRIFLGTVDGGVFRSDDRAQTFTGKFNGLPTDEPMVINSIAIDPNDGTVYMSTGLSVFRSENSGDLWTRADSGLPGRAIRRVAVQPNQPGLLYAATAGGGVYRSFDRGENWTPAAAGSLNFIPQGVTGAMDFSASGGVPPGGVLAIFGVGIGPAQGVSATLDSAGKLPTSLGGVRVYFNDVPAPLFFVSSGQINCQAPFEIAGAADVRIRIEFAGNDKTITVAGIPSRPGVHPTALNQDFSLNSANAPARSGDVIQLFVTGQGLLNAPGVMTGQVAPSTPPFPTPVLSVEVIIAGRTSDIVFVGMAPALVGLLQINVRVPDGINVNETTVVVKIGEQVTPVPGRLFLRR